MAISLLVHAVGIAGIVLGLFTVVVGLLEVRRGKRANGSWIIFIGVGCMALGTALIGFYRLLFFWVGGG